MKTERDAVVVHGNQMPNVVNTKRGRTCPRCGAAPGHSCRRWITGLVKGQDIGGGQWRQLKRSHPER